MSDTKQAFVLVTIPNASLTTPTDTLNGELVLQYVAHPNAPKDIVLILKLDSFETPIDPRQPITQSTLPSGDHEYVFHSTPDDPTELLLTFPAQENIQSEIETLHSVLADYGNFRGDFVPAGSLGTDPEGPGARAIALEDGEEQDLRGRFVLVNEDNGEVIGALDDRIRVREDPTLAEKGHENDPVVVELPEDVEDVEHLSEEELIVRSIPPEQRDWMMKGAVFFSGVISGGTSLVESAMTSASKYYISHSTPEPHSRPNSAPADTKSSGPSSTSATPPPSRTLLFLQSPTTHKALSGINTASGARRHAEQ
ncbi:hypothetical protein EWM64_g7531 [Hericium alpestre]|uniref:Uncharacterized protein n=1 Tax=Hericium alpestre TaxID=135208 RepID=A0A4Y9ZNY1_9AGAM|nr:hypothetical protein EWM64_g7531 [Hericium alpestre]